MALVLANCRRPDERRGDLRAQAAVARRWAAGVWPISPPSGGATDWSGRWGRCGRTAAAVYGAALAGLPAGSYEGVDFVEGDGVDERPFAVAVRVTVGADGLVFDFAGSADEVAGNVNCPRAVTVSACLFVARCLLDPSPFGAAGCADVVEVRTRPGSLVDARMPRAVAGGNVETSQRIVDAILAALGDALDLPAASQGTMNNVTLGGAGFSYYETLGGGGGASRRGPGADGIHSAMTNTMNTPVEAIERDFPLEVVRYELLDGSGGAGMHPGGRGLVRTHARARGGGAERPRRAAARRRAGARGRPSGPPRPHPGRRRPRGREEPARPGGRCRRVRSRRRGVGAGARSRTASSYSFGRRTGDRTAAEQRPGGAAGFGPRPTSARARPMTPLRPRREGGGALSVCVRRVARLG